MTYSTDPASRAAAFASMISCRRMGILSICRVNSRTSQGNGLRSFTPPSLPISVSMNPRGRSLVLRAERAVGSVSVMSTTSRSTNSSARAARSSSWRWKAGSFSLSAKMTTGRAVHLKVSRSISPASNTTDLSACHASSGSGAVLSVARAVPASITSGRKAKRFKAVGVMSASPFPLNICRNSENRRAEQNSSRSFVEFPGRNARPTSRMEGLR